MSMNRMQFQQGLSALALKRYLRQGYPTARLIQYKLMAAMSEREMKHTLSGKVQVNDACFGGELSGGKPAGIRKPELKIPTQSPLA